MPTIAIVGRPNVGKSAIFNRLAERRIAIVHDQPGVTRDRISAPCTLTEHPCTIIDTGGIGAHLEDGFAEQVTIEADPVHLILNKADHVEQELMSGDFAQIGFGAGLPISAAHGRGFGELTELIDDIITPIIEKEVEVEKEVEEHITREGLKIAIVGKPNAGKSSLINAILKDERTIVSEIAGTTRDAIDIPYEFGDERHTLIDTAGLRKRQQMDTSVEVFSAMRTEKSIRRADICLLVVDLAAGISAMDRKIAQTIKEERKPCLIILNKWDLYHPGGNRKDRLEQAEEQIRSELFFLSYAPFAADPRCRQLPHHHRPP